MPDWITDAVIWIRINGSVEMLVKSLSFSLIPQIQPIYRSTFENIQGIENCMINEVFYRAE